MGKKINEILTLLLKRKFETGKDIVVVEGWLHNHASIGAHIEILPGKAPIICAAWQQMIDSDGVSYIGAGPLQISTPALASLKTELLKLANSLAKRGAFGSFGPDFLITSEHEKHFTPHSAILIELNARIPYTGFPLEIVKTIKGNIGSGFFSTHISLKKSATFADILTHLSRKKLLITKKGSNATGVIPFNIAMLPWKSFNVVAMADTWEETNYIVKKVRSVFGSN